MTGKKKKHVCKASTEYQQVAVYSNVPIITVKT